MAYTTTSFMPLKMPTPGSREPAQISLINENMVVVSGHDHANGKGVPVATVRSGLAANRPAPSAAGGIYFATDTGIVSLDNGTAWTDFLTSGGQATVTGWTLVDPVIRDTLQFGPEGSATIDAYWQRTAPATLLTNSNLGVGVVPVAWGSGSYAIQVGAGGVVASTPTVPRLDLGQNTYHDGSTRKAITAGAGALLRLDSGAMTLDTAPSVAAGAAQTFTTRMSVDQAGLLQVTPAAGTNALAAAPMFGNQYWLANPLAGGNLTLNAAGEIVFATGVGGLGQGARRGAFNSTGTLTLTPDAGAGALSITSLASLQYLIALAGIGGIRLNGASLDLNTVGGTHLYCSPSSGYFLPLTNGGFHVGHPSVPVQAVYANTGTIQPSHIETKENITPLDPAACVEAVLDTQWWEFDYKAPPPLEGANDPTEEEAASALAIRHQRGYVLGSPDHRTSDLFGMGDRKSASPQTDLAVVACALQDALRRLAALEANNATA